ncbi:hypothetical protein VTN77DRAFT_5752 [Rasamsonia byssochlamydoides]|uniref:uncharacterized protein n=1 Tax=Rasamsonia byssochlamydoides TaxID=89139 RepID=UPI00374449F4
MLEARLLSSISQGASPKSCSPVTSASTPSHQVQWTYVSSSAEQCELTCLTGGALQHSSTPKNPPRPSSFTKRTAWAAVSP